jgi:hypothetical protein
MSPYEASLGRSPFWTWLRGIAPYPKLLAWCHTTDAFALREILRTGSFRLTHCPVFQEKLLYFFYGRPAYRFAEEGSLYLSCKAPVVIMLSPEFVLQGTRMFPFDTGAFFARRFAIWMHDSMKMSDFELECPSDAPQRHVTSFFGSNIDYLRTRAHAPNVDCTGEFEVESMIALLTDRDTRAADERRTALELQTNRAIAVAYPAVRGLILPDELLKAAFVQKFLVAAGSNMEVLTYPLELMKPAKEYQLFLEERAIQFQERWGLV